MLYTATTRPTWKTNRPGCKPSKARLRKLLLQHLRLCAALGHIKELECHSAVLRKKGAISLEVLEEAVYEEQSEAIGYLVGIMEPCSDVTEVYDRAVDRSQFEIARLLLPLLVRCDADNIPARLGPIHKPVNMIEEVPNVHAQC